MSMNNRRNSAKASVDGHYQNADCKAYSHHTELLPQHPELDAIIIATPDHWHARISIDAANAGLHIFGEKPFTWGLAEGRRVIDAMTKNKRSGRPVPGTLDGEFRRFHALIRNNTLGKLTRFECGTPCGLGIRNLQSAW